MAVLKNKTQGRYLNMNRHALENKLLPLKERGLLATLLSLPDTWDFSINGIVAILPDGRHAVSASLQKLMDEGYVVKYQDRDENGKFGEIVIEVYDVPSKPIAENPITANRISDSPVAEKPVQLNNKELNNKKLNNNRNNKFNNFEQREYKNMEALERALLEC